MSEHKYVTYGESVYFLNGEYTITDLNKLIESEKKRTKMLDESMRKVKKPITKSNYPCNKLNLKEWHNDRVDKHTNK